MVEKAKEKSKITAIYNKYKDPLDDLIDNLDEESPNRPKLLDKGSRNIRFKNSSISHLEGDCRLDSKDVWDLSLELEPKTRDFQVHQCHNIALFGLKNERA